MKRDGILFLLTILYACGGSYYKDKPLGPSINDNGSSGNDGRYLVDIRILSTEIDDCDPQDSDDWKYKNVKHIGNCDGIINPNELVTFKIWFKNESSGDYYFDILEVLPNDSNVELIEGNLCLLGIEFGGDKIPGETKFGSTKPGGENILCFAFKYNGSIESARQVNFKVKIGEFVGKFNDDGDLEKELVESFIIDFSQEVKPTDAHIILESYSIMDSLYETDDRGNDIALIIGDGNGLADPNERVGLRLHFKNVGSSGTHLAEDYYSNENSLEVVSESWCVDFYHDEYGYRQDIPTHDVFIGPSDEFIPEFCDPCFNPSRYTGIMFYIPSNCPSGTKIIFRWTIVDYYKHTWQGEFNFYVSQKPVVCVPDCSNKECGDDGCGGSCGKCPDGKICISAGLCFSGTTNCGDGKCTESESCDSCPEDCGSCSKKEFGEECASNNECLSGLCLNWSSVGIEGGRCGKYCSSDSDCPESCCSFQSEDGKKNCALPSLASKYCFNVQWSECTMLTKCVDDNNCQDNQCFENCAVKFSPTAKLMFIDFINCLDQNGYFDCANDNCKNDIIQNKCWMQAQTCLNGGGIINCLEEKIYIRVSNIDDSAEADINGEKVLSGGYGYDSGFVDVTSYFTSNNKNVIRFVCYNNGGGYTWGFEVKCGGVVMYSSIEGIVGVKGAFNNDQTQGKVFDSEIQIAY